MKNPGCFKKEIILLSIIIAMFFLMLIFVDINRSGARENDWHNADVIHQIHYSQEQLVQQLNHSLNNDLALDYNLLKEREIADVLSYLSPEVSRANTRIAWIQEQLDDCVFLESREYDDGTVYVGMDTNSLELVFVAVNDSEDTHSYVLQVENTEKMRAVSYAGVLSPIIEIEDTEDTDFNDLKNHINFVTESVESKVLSAEETQGKEDHPTVDSQMAQEEEINSIVNFEELLPAGEISTRETIFFEEIFPNESTSEEMLIFVEENEETISTDPTTVAIDVNKNESAITGFRIDEIKEIEQPNIQNGAVLMLSSNGIGVLRIKTGLLQGGPLNEQTLSHELNDITFTRPLAGGFSGMTFANPLEARTRKLFAASASTAGNSGSEGELRIYSQGDSSGGINPPENDFATYSYDHYAIAYDLSGADISPQNIEIRGNGYGHVFRIVLNNTQPVTIKSLNNSLMNSSNQVLTIVGNGNTLYINNADADATSLGKKMVVEQANLFIEAPKHKALYAPVEGSVVLTNNASVEVQSSVNPVYLRNGSLGVYGQSQFIADGMGQADQAIRVDQEVYSTENSLIHGKNASYGIHANIVCSYGGSPEYIAEKDAITSTEKSRIVGEGFHVGIFQNNGGADNGVFYGAGSVIYGEGSLAGMDIARFIAKTNNGDFQGNGEMEQIHLDSILKENKDIGRPEYKPFLEMNQYATLFAIGTGDESNGLKVHYTTGIQSLLVSNDARLIAVGKENGIFADADIRVGAVMGGSIYTYGESNAGIQVYTAGGSGSTAVRVWHAGKIYARGGQYGVLCTRGPISVGSYGTDSSAIWGRDPGNGGGVLVAIGGIEDQYMAGVLRPGITDTTENRDSYSADFDILQEHMNYSPKEMPRPKLDDDLVTGKGLLLQPSDMKPNTYGIRSEPHTGYTSAVVSVEDQLHEIYAYGGEFGVWSGDADISSKEGARLLSWGGRIGSSASTNFFCWSGGSVDSIHARGTSYLAGYGAEIGLEARFAALSVVSGSNGESPGYVYGYGKTHGIKVASYIYTDDNQTIVAETEIRANAKSGPEAGAAIHTGNPLPLQNNKGTTCLIHEVYTVIWDDENRITNTPPYEINSKILPFSINMGNNTANLPKLNWTTPSEHPNRQQDGRHYFDYDPADDQGLIEVAVENDMIGLVSSVDADDLTIQAQSIVNASDSNVGGKIKEDFVYRLTILPAKTKTVDIVDIRVMDVEIDLFENNLPGDPYSIKNILPSASYKIEFVPESPDQNIGLNGNGKDENGNWIDSGDMAVIDKDTVVNPPDVPSAVDVVDGKIHLKKLRMGTYTLTPVVQIGYPYEYVSPIQFELKVDKQSSDHNQWVETLYITDPLSIHDGNRQITEITIPTAYYQNPTKEGDGVATLSPIDPAYDKNTQSSASFRWYVERKNYPLGMDFALIDARSFSQTQRKIPGSFQMKVYRDSIEIESMMQTLTDIQNPALWGTVDCYAGLEYSFSQISTELDNYMVIPDDQNEYRVRVHENWNYALDPQNPVFDSYELIIDTPIGQSQYYRSYTEHQNTPFFIVRALNVERTELPHTGGRSIYISVFSGISLLLFTTFRFCINRKRKGVNKI